MKLLYGTGNLAKLSAMRNRLEQLDIELIGLNDLRVEGKNVPEVKEDGNTPLENARLKAMVYYEAFQIPVFSCDSGLYFDNVPDEVQPGVHVRNVNGKCLSDDEMIDYYSGLVKAYGNLVARYRNAICFVMDNTHIYEATVLGAVINIILDPIFIFVFHLGVKGAALATVLSQAVGAIWILRFLSGKKTILHLRKENFKLQKEIILPCLALGISTFVMLSTESILSISFTSSLSRYGGDLAVGAMTIITSVSQLATLPLQGICQGGQPIMSYNYGAGNRNRVKKAFFTQFTVCTIFTGCFWLIMLLFPKIFAGIFSNNTELITYTAWALRIYMAGIFSLGFQVACQQSFMALGQAKVSLLLACLRKLILLIPLIFILPHFIQNKVFAVFLAEPISDILAAIITTSTFFSQFNKILDRK